MTAISVHPGSGAILAAVHDLAATLARDVAANEAARVLPRESVTAVRATGLPALRVPARYGGPGGSLRDLFGVILEVAAADPNLAQGLRSHFGFVESLLSRPGPRCRGCAVLSAERRGATPR